MSINLQNFLVSVADCVGRDPNTGYAVFYGHANISSALTISMTATDVRGGIGNELLYVFLHDKKVEVKVTQATFGEPIVALNAGTSVLNSAVTVLQTDQLTLSASGSATLTQTPNSSTVTVCMANGTFSTVTPSGTSITGLSGANTAVTAIYTYSVTADQLTMSATTPPTVVDLTLLAQVRDNTGTIVQYLQIDVPRFQVAGNYTMSLAANNVSNQELDGFALAQTAASGDYYLTATWITAAGQTTPYFDIADYPSSMSFSVAAGLPKSSQITVYGLRGGVNANTVLTSSASFSITAGCTVGSGSVASGLFTVTGYAAGSAGGLVTAGSSCVAGYTATIKSVYIDPTNGSLVDYCIATVTA
jgi:hypothetical protein